MLYHSFISYFLLQLSKPEQACLNQVPVPRSTRATDIKGTRKRISFFRSGGHGPLIERLHVCSLLEMAGRRWDKHRATRLCTLKVEAKIIDLDHKECASVGSCVNYDLSSNHLLQYNMGIVNSHEKSFSCTVPCNSSSPHLPVLRVQVIRISLPIPGFALAPLRIMKHHFGTFERQLG